MMISSQKPEIGNFNVFSSLQTLDLSLEETDRVSTLDRILASTPHLTALSIRGSQNNLYTPSEENSIFSLLTKYCSQLVSLELSDFRSYNMINAWVMQNNTIQNLVGCDLRQPIKNHLKQNKIKNETLVNKL